MTDNIQYGLTYRIIILSTLTTYQSNSSDGRYQKLCAKVSTTKKNGGTRQYHGAATDCK